MRLVTDEYSKAVLLLVCLIKVYHDAGIDIFERGYKKELIDMDYYYDYVMEAISNAAPKTISDEHIYNKFGYSEDDCEVYVWAYSSDEFEEYYRIARKLHRLEGAKTKENPYIKGIERKMEEMRGFFSYAYLGSSRGSQGCACKFYESIHRNGKRNC